MVHKNIYWCHTYFTSLNITFDQFGWFLSNIRLQFQITRVLLLLPDSHLFYFCLCFTKGSPDCSVRCLCRRQVLYFYSSNFTNTYWRSELTYPPTHCHTEDNTRQVWKQLRHHISQRFRTMRNPFWIHNHRQWKKPHFSSHRKLGIILHI